MKLTNLIPVLLPGLPVSLSAAGIQAKQDTQWPKILVIMADDLASILKMKKELYRWMDEQGDTGAAMDK